MSSQLEEYAMKSELYVVALTFSILAISIQFPAETSDVCIGRLQALGWVFLVVSGIAGITLLRNVSRDYNQYLTKRRLEDIMNGARLDDVSKKEFRRVYSEESKNLSRNKRFWWPVQGYCLAVGLLFLATARILNSPIY
ncbi:hypothetical protein [Thiocapsa roseopersicina]|uniref:Uncharacterized protein n=1 Tax=Thiocapsa roseopersicina TaxID=1058 RepID=A0A1H3BTM7_THIRO|nr:hypothetical protein [Thiocapsa roseopersicina]SDX45028.1 hypothetical protein SAMN05421783_1271 [Thiocapsa roseopersicina]